ncbi:MAG: cytochrome d ubiquinol oxidase subunit II [Ilumatobacter coccineus]|uniref:Cytochrome d ubiquinol oxidase subunit II n=1 Tax=Ilumatobacter coccineus TaxID=467094 RepID=A0A2G6K987_9ACTN|nr:MAG: cytochrome d ubiquinol oxidase subunit II [Ilumatobacter coccineus]
MLIAVLWIGYLILEGYDYGVAMLIRVLGKDDTERRVIVNTIGPLWDGNEVWLLTAGGATFAAFPGWYATLFSGLYLPLFLILIGLIIRGVSFEYRAKHPDHAWRNRFDYMAGIGSFVVALVFGVGFGNFIIGLPVVLAEGSESLHVVDGSPYFWNLFSPFALLAGVVLVVLFLFHGALFLALKTSGIIHERARDFATKAGLVAIVGGAVFLIWQHAAYPGAYPVLGWLTALVAALGLVAAWLANRADRNGWAFIGTAVTTAMVAVGIFLRMWPNLGFNSSKAALPLDRITAASTDSTLKIMTIAAIVFVPIVLAYQAWSVWVFRHRLNAKLIPEHAPVVTPN